MFILSSISRGLKFWSVNHTSVYENSESKVFKNKKIFGWNIGYLTGRVIRNKSIQDSWILLMTIINNIAMH